MSLPIALSMSHPGPSQLYNNHYLGDDDDDDGHSDAMSTTSFAPFSRSVASSRTSVDMSVRSASPAPSVFSMTSSMRENSFRREYGRGLNNYSEVYRLPADEEELQRLDQQHIMFIEVMGKYPPPLPQVMAPEFPGETKSCLDLGCGSGSWIMEVARQFPHCNAVAVDLVPMQSLSMPPNLRSEVDDINLGLEHYYGDFNTVHARLISSGIKDYAGLIDHISRVLRPGGLIDLTEFDFRVYGGDKKVIIPQTNAMQSPWFPRWMSFTNMAARQRGGHVDAASLLRTWVQEHGSFENIVYREFWIQVSPWRFGNDPETQRLNAIGAVMRDDIKAFLKSGRPLLLGSGLPESLVDELEQNVVEELDLAVQPMYIRVQSVYALKSHS